MVNRRALLLEAGLVLSASLMAARIVHTPAAPPQSERDVVTRLVWASRTGAIEQAFDLPGRYVHPMLSRDEASVFLTRMPGPGRVENWKYTFANAALERVDADPEWTAARNLLRFPEEVTIVQEDRSRDGRWFAFTVSPNWLNFRLKPVVHWNEPYLVDASASTARPLFSPPIDSIEIRFSRDGSRVALTSSRSGRNEVYTAGLPPDPGAPVRISMEGGHAPEWGPQQELYYIDTNGDLRSSDHALFHMASIAGPEFEYRYGGYSVAADGRFLIVLQKRR